MTLVPFPNKIPETGRFETARLYARVSTQALKDAIELLIKELAASPAPADVKQAAIASLRDWNLRLTEFSTRVAQLRDGGNPTSARQDDEA